MYFDKIDILFLKQAMLITSAQYYTLRTFHKKGKLSSYNFVILEKTKNN